MDRYIYIKNKKLRWLLHCVWLWEENEKREIREREYKKREKDEKIWWVDWYKRRREEIGKREVLLFLDGQKYS